MKQNVTGLQIPVENLLLKQHLKASPQLQKYLNGLQLSQSLLIPNMISQCASIAKLVHQIIVIHGSEHLNELDNVRMSYFCQDDDFVVRELP